MNRDDDSLGQVRPLTPGERALVAGVFGDAIDPAPVTVRRAKWWPFQPRRVTMAPDGHLWCHPHGPNWSPDYAAEPLGMQAHFIHEMTHVWQYQQRGHLALRRLPLARYRYHIVPGKPFARYGIEQQARIVEDAFRARARGMPDDVLEAVLPFSGWNVAQAAN